MQLTEISANERFRLMAEFEPTSESFLAWPERRDNWRDGGKPAQVMFRKLAELIAQYQPVTMLVSREQYQNAYYQIGQKTKVVEMSFDDVWLKDTGPFYITNGREIKAVDFKFNAWGGLLDGLYFPWDQDDLVAQKVLDLQAIDYYKAELILEGCAILVDGEGTMIATEEVVLSEGRNINLDKNKIEKIFRHYFGIEKVIWLQDGYFMDETGGDIDNMVNFIAPGEIVLTWTDDRTDPQFEISQRAYDILSSATDAKGRSFRIHKMQMPAPLYLTDEEAHGVDPINGRLPRNAGRRLTATYVNYITLTDVIIMPWFNDPQDAVAQEELQGLYPSRQILTIPVREFLNGGGGLHTLVINTPDLPKDR